MLFNSLLFLLLYLPLVWAGFRLCVRFNHRFAVGWLVGASLLFYGWWTPAYLLLLCASILFNYAAGVLIQRSGDKARVQQVFLTFGVTANLLLLCYYKYLFPFLHWIERYGIHIVPPNAAILLPLGISFFTFTQIGYLIDCKAGLASGHRFLDYALFVTFFPHLIAGPILHHREMMPQFEKKETWQLNIDNIVIGLVIFFIGLAKKDLVADTFAIFANKGFANPTGLTTLGAWCTALSFSVQLYFDFSGYSEMAIGLALLFNIRFPANFDSPYKCTSIIDFWQRWHMTLTRYLNLYVYNPVAMWITRRRVETGLPVGRKGLKTLPGFFAMVAFPTFFAVVLAGIWHGAGTQFIIFGLLHSFYLTVNHAWRTFFPVKNTALAPGIATSLGVVWKVLLTYLAVLFAEIFFRASSMENAFALLTGMAGHHSPLFTPNPELSMKAASVLLVPTFFLIWFAPNVLQIFNQWEPTLSKPHSPGPGWFEVFRWKPTLQWAAASGLLAALAILGISGTTEFLYFRF